MVSPHMQNYKKDQLGQKALKKDSKEKERKIFLTRRL